MQLKYSFKKEWLQFMRTFRMTVIIIVFFAVAVLNPALFGLTSTILKQVDEMPGFDQFASASFSFSEIDGDDFSEIGLEDMLDMYSDAGAMFSVTATSIISTGVLVTMLLLMSAAGGEQKKRAMIVPMCSGLSYKNYLIPKFVIYPISVFLVSFLSTCFSGALCNVIFPNNHVSADRIVLIAFLAAVYTVFQFTVYLSLGLCTSRPGIMAASVYIGSTIIEGLLQGFGLYRFHPFAITALISSIGMVPDYPVKEETFNIVVTIAIAAIICIMMFFLALAVLSTKKINNREEIKPEF